MTRGCHFVIHLFGCGSAALIPYQRDFTQNGQEIRNPNLEILNKFKVPNSNDQNIYIESVLKFSHSDFGFVSDFTHVEFKKGRASYLVPALPG